MESVLKKIDLLAFLLFRHTHGQWEVGEAIMHYQKKPLPDDVFLLHWNECSEQTKNYYKACVNQYTSEYKGGKIGYIPKATNDTIAVDFDRKSGKPLYAEHNKRFLEKTQGKS